VFLLNFGQGVATHVAFMQLREIVREVLELWRTVSFYAQQVEREKTHALDLLAKV
jgi:hypothetical protein